ncbi:MAG: hypothetical protein AAB588_02270 [Patescibacteria group bacterium]
MTKATIQKLKILMEKESKLKHLRRFKYKLKNIIDFIKTDGR